MLALNQRPFCWDDICGQKIIIQEMKKRSLTRDFPSVIIFGGESGTGKAQPLDALVFTPAGFTRMGDLQVGDMVVGVDGKPCKILGVFPQGVKPVYAFEWSDGTITESCKDHLWVLQNSMERTGRRQGLRVFTTQEIVNASDHSNAPGKPPFGNMFSAPINDCVDFPAKTVPIDPYLLGNLIANGTLSEPTPLISVYEDDIRARIQQALADIRMHLNKATADDTNQDYRLVMNIQGGIQKEEGARYNKIAECLFKWGLNTTSSHKFIPSEYLYNTKDVRLAILRGLYDGDGLTKESGMSYTTTSERLSEDICFLARSLGGVAKISYQGERKPGQRAYSIKIQLPNDRLPFLSEKRKRNFNSPQRDPYKTIKRIYRAADKECRCIYVESPYHCYLTNGFTVTHNTTVSLIIAALLNDEHPLRGEGCLNPNPESPESKAILNETFNMSCGMYDASRMAKEDVMRLEETVSSASMFGGKRVVIIDEAQELSKTSKGVTLKLLEKKRQDAYIILCTMNPDAFDKSIRSRGLYYQFRSPSSFDIAEYLFKLTDQFGKDAPDSFIQEGLIAIAENCEGSVRMAVQNFERCLAGELYTAEAIQNAFGFLSDAKLFDMVSKILNQNVEVFKDIRTMGLKDFFYASYKFISDCLIYARTKTVDAIWKAEQYNRLENQRSRVAELFNLYADIDQRMGAYFKPAYYLARLSDFFAAQPKGLSNPAVGQSGHKVR
jgi:DNA polymerase III delta prime subunit